MHIDWRGRRFLQRTRAVEALGKDADDAQVDEEGAQQHQRRLQAQEAQHAADVPGCGRVGPPAWAGHWK